MLIFFNNYDILHGRLGASWNAWGVDLGWKTSPPKEDGTAVCVMDSTGSVGEIERPSSRLPVTTPRSLDAEVVSTKPGEFKSTMDKVDAVISVLCVYCHWLYSGERTEVLGDTEDGFVLLPR